MIEVLGEFGIEILTLVVNNIYESGHVPQRPVEICVHNLTKETRFCRMRATRSRQPHESRVQTLTKGSNAKGQKQDKNGDRSGTVLISGRKGNSQCSVCSENHSGMFSRSTTRPVAMLH